MQTIDPEPAATEPGTQTAGTARRGRVAGRGRTLVVGALGARRRALRGPVRGHPGRRRDRGRGPAVDRQPGASQATGDNEVIIDVVEQVAPAVVTINVSATVNESQFPAAATVPRASCSRAPARASSSSPTGSS